MQCPRCQHDNEDGSRFCESCGEALRRACRACGTPLSAQARFCSQCGAAAEADAEPAAPPAPRATRLSGERRQLTVMFCDLAGYTALSQRLDPEELREILTAYQRACVRAVRQFGGHVAQFLGDGVLVYFGFPRAQEDAAERALRAALAIRAGLNELNQQRAAASAEAIAIRIGIHTGQVVVTEVGADSRQETLALGDTTNVAARLEALAEPGQIYVSHATLRLAPDLFRTRDLGTPPLKGVTEPIRVHALDGTQGVALRFRPPATLTPFTGRDQELAQLLHAWQQAREGEGRVVLVSGEPGIGKSRLLRSFGEQIAHVPHFTLELACSRYEAGSAFQPLIELLERGLGFAEEDPPELRVEKLEDRMAGIPGLELPEVIPFLASLLGLPGSKRYPLEHMGPELQRERMLHALAAPVVALALGQPLLVLCEDLHWSDPSTLELLARLIEVAPTLPLLIVATFRTGFEPPWPMRSCMSVLALQRLGRNSTLEVVRAAAQAAQRLPDEVLETLVERADGVPLFAEELARSVVESGLRQLLEPAAKSADAAAPLPIPSTLQDSLMARLDRLDPGKQVAQIAAALGRTFGHALIEAVGELEPERLNLGLTQLVDAEILYQSGSVPRASYTFKHALLQDTAYESQLRSRRRQLHSRIAATLQEHFPQRVAAEPETMARHCAAGGLVREAVEYYQQAGDQAVTRIAYREASGYYARALELLETLPEDALRHAKEIDLRMAQAPALGALRGYEDAELRASIERTEQLCQALGPGPQQIPGLLKLMLFHTHVLPRAREFAKALLAVVEPLGIGPLRVAGYMIRGTGALTSATVPEACADLKQALEIAEATELAAPRAAFEVDALAMACCTYSIALVQSGKPDTASTFAERGIERARQLAHPRTLASALQNGAMAFHLIGDSGRSGDLSVECLALIEGRGFHEIEASAHVLSGWARARRGDRTAVEEMDAALRSAEAHGVLAGMTQLYFVSAEAHALQGDRARALEQLERGEALMERTGERGYEPQAALVRARLALGGGPEAIEALDRWIGRALELSERYRAPWQAIEAATLRGRLALETRRGIAEARDCLTRRLAEFDEGFQREPLREARATLDRLSA